MVAAMTDWKKATEEAWSQGWEEASREYYARNPRDRCSEDRAETLGAAAQDIE